MHIRVTPSPSEHCSLEWAEIGVHLGVTTNVQLPNLPLACRQDTIETGTDKVLLLLLY